jgi:hypothetical protein
MKSSDEEDVAFAGLDRVERHARRLQRGRAVAVHRRRGDGVRDPGEERAGPTDVDLCAADGTADDVVDLSRIDPCLGDGGFHGARQEVIRTNIGE